MAKSLIKFVLLFLFGFIALAAFSYWRLSQSWENERKEMVMQLVEEVENFKRLQNRLPEERELNPLVSELESVYYQKEDSNSYIVCYGTSLGESKIFDSNTKSWRK